MISSFFRLRVLFRSFMFYFKNGSRLMAIDATDEKQDFGPARLINHSRKNPNMTPRVDNHKRKAGVHTASVCTSEKSLHTSS